MRKDEREESAHVPRKKMRKRLKNKLNLSESIFSQIAEREGKTLTRHGWPDFLVEHNGSVVAVEVKTGPDRVRENQKRCFAALERGGIAVFVWDPDHPRELTPWRKYNAIAARRDGTLSGWHKLGQTKMWRKVCHQVEST